MQELGGLLSIDVGLKTGYAVFNSKGCLIRYQARRIDGKPQLRKFSWQLIKELKPSVIYLEGGGEFAEVWKKSAEKNSISVIQVYAEQWREKLLWIREQRNGKLAKHSADIMAHKIIENSPAPNPTCKLTSDVAEAILFGLWACLDHKWLEKLPTYLH